ncbi:MAG: DUF882 domain-containing protein [Hyphomicrobiaceae bacterium]
MILATVPGQLEANSDRERTIAIYNIHKKETVKVVYKRDGKYIPSAMKKLNWVMRDWRRNEAQTMDPKLIDIIWEIHTELGSKRPVHLISGFRSRKTNNKLRKKRGGQARNSRHILGKAADIHFPDVPVRKLRYSALVRERGGVGYYPTSALPFIHVDTGRVRHWPRMGRTELALLTKGRSRHVPKGGRPVTRADYQNAKRKNAALAKRIAAFHAGRGKPAATTAIASLDTSSPKNWIIPQPKLATRPAKPKPETQVAALTPVPAPSVAQRPAASPRKPKLATKPAKPEPETQVAALTPVPVPSVAQRPAASPGKPKSRPKRKAPDSKLPEPILTGLDELPETDTRATGTPAPAATLERTTLASLARQAVNDPDLPRHRPVRKSAKPGGIPGLPEPPAPTRAPRETREPVQVASIDPEAGLDVLQPVRETPSAPFFELSGWATAPEYDDEHGGELSYRPFPIGPLLTETQSVDDPFLARLVHPDLVGARELVGRDEQDIPLRFKPGIQYAEMLWSDIFAGGGVNDLLSGDPALRPWAQNTEIAQQ